MNLPPLYISFLWHMHQPNYRDPTRNRYSMPWVRLHATKAYYDMPSLLSNFPSIKEIFNLVPALLVQLQDYASGQAKDTFLDLVIKPADELTLEDKEFVLTHFFNFNWETMVKPYPRYWQLLLKRGMAINEARIGDIVPGFNTQDFLDLQVWFNLTWFGYTSQKIPAINELFQKGKFFTEMDKETVLTKQREIIKEIIPLYAKLAGEKQIEITTSPFYHPILPLLIDSDFAKRSVPEARLPQRFHFPEDAYWHLAEAINFHTEIFDQRPKGLWPSEGSVCPELIPFISELGIKWTATDEAILFNSLSGHGSYNEDALYYPYLVEHKGERVNMIFRDRKLSDLFGFVYHRNPPHQAAEDFLSQLYRIKAKWQSGKNPLLLSIILDGENPWEYYDDGGKTFLAEVYEKLSKSADFKTTTISEYLEEFPPKESIANLYTGSWINHNFGIWIGGTEENKAWTLLGQTRNFLATKFKEKQDLPDKVLHKVWTAIHSAEGSDWFWWYGDQFSSAYSFEFDRLFRENLSQVYLLLGTKVPEDLLSPIKQAQRVTPTKEPAGFIHPIIDGRQTGFLEWSGAGYFEPTAISTMYQEKTRIASLYYGFDVENLYFRFDPQESEFSNWPQDLEVCLYLLNSQPHFLTFRPKAKEEAPYYRLYKGGRENNDLAGEFQSIGISKIIELGVSFKDLSLKVGEEIRFWLEVREKGLLQERCPATGYLIIVVPDENFEKIHWQI